MVAGDLLVIEYQYEFRNLLIGSGTSYVTEKVTGLLGMPPTASTDIDRQAEHGSYAGVLLMNKRTVALDVKTTGFAREDIEEKLAALRAAFQPPRKRHSRDLDPFVFWRPGDVKKVLYARCTKRDLPSDYDTARGLNAGSIELVAPDPIIYSLETFHRTLILNSGVSSASVACTMGGDYVDGAFPIITINGPCTNPRITNSQDENRGIRIDVALAAGDALQINTKAKSIKQRVGLGGAWVDAYAFKRSDNQWWALLPGLNDVTYTRSGVTTASSTMTIDWQDAYV